MSHWRLTVSVLILVLAVSAWCGVVFGPQYAPTLIGSQRKFFSRCAAVSRGADSKAVLVAMRGFVLARRDGKRIVDDALIEARPALTPDRNGETSYLFYPTESATADWCVVHFRMGRVHRIDLLPD
jgi:hypothetical protein